MKITKSTYPILILILIGLSGLIATCDSPLDAEPPDKFDADYVFTSTRNARSYVFETYNVLPYDNSDVKGYNRLGSGAAMIASASDEAVPNITGLNIEFLYDGSLSPSSSNPDSRWEHNYEYIRAINIGLANIDKMPESDSALREHLRAELIFLRAFAHFELVKRFGGVPIIDRVLSPGDDLNIPRNTFEECVNFIISELDKAIPELLLPQEAVQNNFGRISSGAAMALKARVLLYAASPLFNGPGYDGSGSELISYGTSSGQRWEAAAEAAADVINLDFYSLYTPSEITNAQTDAEVRSNGVNNYSALFYTLQGNRELILSRNSPAGNAVEKKNAPVGYTNGEGTTNPTQQMVDAYGMLNGESIDDPASGYDPANPYVNRDPRFYASIFYNGKEWLGRTVETFEGGIDNPDGAAAATRTGYYLAKFMNPNVNISGNEGSTYHSFPLFRYAEVLLNYAEAVNEAYGPDADPFGIGMTARQAVERVRGRVLRPADAAIDAANQGEMRDVIRAERRVELAFEDHRHLDVKRWMIAGETLGQDLSGIRITTAEDNGGGLGQYTASDAEVGEELAAHPAENAYDGDTETRWASWNIVSTAWIRFDLGQTESVSEVRILFDRPDVRGPYPIAISVGGDPNDLQEVWLGDASPDTDFQTFAFSSTDGRYVEIRMTDFNGSEFNSVNQVLSIFEVEISGGEDEGSNYTYEIIPNILTREFSDRMYLYPIPINVMSRNKALMQNPGW